MNMIVQRSKREQVRLLPELPGFGSLHFPGRRGKRVKIGRVVVPPLSYP